MSLLCHYKSKNEEGAINGSPAVAERGQEGVVRDGAGLFLKNIFDTKLAKMGQKKGKNRLLAFV